MAQQHYGTSGNDTLQGTYVDNNGTRNWDDIFNAGAGNDSISAGDGNDSIYGEAGNDYVDAGWGNDFVSGGDGADTLLGSYGDDLIFGDQGDDSISGGAGNDTLTGSLGNDLINGDDGADIIDGGEGTDSLTGGYGDDIIYGSDGNDSIDGGNNADVLYGDEGNDVILGGNGEDTLYGGAGNDKLFASTDLDNNGDWADELNGGEGNDTLAGWGATLNGDEGDDTLTVYNYGIAKGGEGNDKISILAVTTRTSNSTLEGGAGNDSIKGSSYSDTLDGGTGNDTLDGAAGNDTYIIDSLLDVIQESDQNPSADYDTVLSSISYSIAETSLADAKLDIEKLVLTGSSNLNATGNSRDNTLVGNAGNNILDGGYGTDSLQGGAGDDTYIINVTADVITEAEGNGFDTIKYSHSDNYSFNSYQEIEAFIMLNQETIRVDGNKYNNAITANSAANILYGNDGNDKLIGLAGNDTLFGGTGNDTLDGGTGTDSMTGGTGNDNYYIDSSADLIVEYTNEGNDSVYSSINYSLANNNALENLTLTASAINATGNALSNRLVGNAAANNLNGGLGNDTLDGGTGSDTLIGGTGDDTYLVDAITDVVTENAGEGADWVSSQNLSLNLASYANVERIQLLGTANLNATGNALANILNGNAGNNILNGAAGSDTLAGGLGNDTYIVDASTDVISETSTLSTEIDTVQSAVTWVLGVNLENLTLIGTAAINGTGNALANTLIGNAGNNTLNGGAGNDVIIGGAGKDNLSGGAGADRFDFDLLTDIGVGVTLRDTITDFKVSDGDMIDLSSIDANTAVALDQAFTFVNAFTAVGQVKFAGGILSINTDSNLLTAEYEIALTGVTALTGTSLIL